MPANTAKPNLDDDELQMIWGAAAIGAALRRGPEAWTFIYVALGIVLSIEGTCLEMIELGQDFDASKLASVPNVQDVPKLGVERIVAHFPASGADVNGWTFFKPGGRYGTDYIQRALVTRFGLGCNIAEDAVYPSAKTDSAGQKLDGANKYVIRFPKGEMPPVRGFWSLTMYDANWFFANPLNRYTLSQRNALKSDPDGSVDLYIQAADPGGAMERTAAWRGAKTANSQPVRPNGKI